MLSVAGCLVLLLADVVVGCWLCVVGYGLICWLLFLWLLLFLVGFACYVLMLIIDVSC